MRLNNKGQSLVLFVLIIPILLGVMVLVIDMGNVIYYKNDLNSIDKIMIDYGLDNINESDVIYKMKELGLVNNRDMDVDIRFRDMEFMVDSTYYVKGIFSNIFDIDGYKVESKYKGYIDDSGDKIIKKIK